MSPMPSENGRKSSRFKAKGPKMPTINVSHVKNSPHMVFFLVSNSFDQGWVDYKSFVVRYNYSYFKNM